MIDRSDIIRLLNAGDESALQYLYSSFFHTLCAFGSHFVDDNEAVADIVQEVFIKIWDKREAFDSVYSVRSFMYVSVRNACLNHKRNNAKISKIGLDTHYSESLAEEEYCWVIEEEVHGMIRNEIERLPGAIKKVIDFTLLDMTVAEIADVLKLSENTVRNQRARGKEILRSRLGDKLFLLFF